MQHDKKKLFRQSAIVIVIFLLIGIVWWFKVGNFLDDKKEMEDYLRNKYHKEFEVSNLKDSRTSLSGKPVITGSSSYKTDDYGVVTFEVTKDDNFKGQKTDRLLQSIWKNEVRSRLCEILNIGFSGCQSYSVNVIFNEEDLGRVDYPITSFFALSENVKTKTLVIIELLNEENQYTDKKAQVIIDYFNSQHVKFSLNLRLKGGKKTNLYNNTKYKF